MAGDSYGLNKSARLAAKRAVQDEEKKREALPLDEGFPFEMVPFSPSFFGARPSLPADDEED